MIETVAVDETSAIHLISTQSCQWTHPADLPEINRVLFCCNCHHIEEPCEFLFIDHNMTLRCHVRSDPQGVWYLYFYITDTTITLRVRGGRNCQNDAAKEKKPHDEVYRRLSEFGELQTATYNESSATLYMLYMYLICPNVSIFYHYQSSPV
jgi:hypothetical protein